MIKKSTLLCLAMAAALFLTSCRGEKLVSPFAKKEPEPPVETSAPQNTPQDTLQELPVFAFTRDNFPRIDGSTSTAPLAQAAACVLLGETREAVTGLVAFNKTTQSFRNLADGLCDILIVAEPSPEVLAEIKKQGFEIEIAPIATEALVFVVNASNPVDNLTTKQIQDIYTGKVTNWSQLGGDDVEITAFQRNEEAGSQVLMEKLVMENLRMAAPPEQTFMVAMGMGELITAIKSFDGSANAIGYTVYYYAEDMRMAEGLKMLCVDGVYPSVETIADGRYPFLNPYYAAISAKEAQDSPARVMYEWLLSSEGQALIAHEGYVSIKGASQ
ncbi:MAG: substrate-binding domain-containing protein [Oscillospiraceae bacterium]|jgi:phosphate transport system substrate-binding protein|nr:substrate-binding domain-containing protein [Oscillospiraceae bacterium]